MQRLLFMRLRRIAQLVVLAAVVLIAAVTAGVLQADGSSASTPPAGDHGPRPALVTAFAAWDGVNYTASCSGCLPPDAQVASGGGYVFEMVNASYEIWTAGGTLVMSNTLDVLFNAGSDLLADPQLRFDSTVLRWFATVDDLHNDQILYASSESSDPTGGWYLQHFNVAGGNVPRLTSLGLDSLNLVVATNVYQSPEGRVPRNPGMGRQQDPAYGRGRGFHLDPIHVPPRRGASSRRGPDLLQDDVPCERWNR